MCTHTYVYALLVVVVAVVFSTVALIYLPSLMHPTDLLNLFIPTFLSLLMLSSSLGVAPSGLLFRKCCNYDGGCHDNHDRYRER